MAGHEVDEAHKHHLFRCLKEPHLAKLKKADAPHPAVTPKRLRRRAADGAEHGKCIKTGKVHSCDPADTTLSC